MGGSIKRVLEPEYWYRVALQTKTRGAKYKTNCYTQNENNFNGKFNIDVIVAVEISSLSSCTWIRKKVRASTGNEEAMGKGFLCNFSLTDGPKPSRHHGNNCIPAEIIWIWNLRWSPATKGPPLYLQSWTEPARPGSTQKLQTGNCL